MSTLQHSIARPAAGVLESDTRRLLRNTYALLAMTLLFSAGTAGVALLAAAPPLPWWLTLAGFFGLFFVLNAVRDSVWALPALFALTGFMGYSLGPLVGAYLGMAGGPAIVMQAFAGTGAIFIALSAYAMKTTRDFSFLGGFLMAGMIVALLASIGAIVFALPALSLAVSAVVVLLMSGFILYETQALVSGGERNYVLATAGLYLSIYNLFTSLLHLLGVFGSQE